MNKKILILIPLIVVMLMSACSKKVDNTASKETKEGEITLEQYLDSEMTEAEQSIGFTRDTRRDFIEKYGPEKYSISYHVLSNILFSFKYDQSPILDSDTDMYKNDSQIEVVEYESSLEDHHRITADYVTNGDDMRDTVFLGGAFMGCKTRMTAMGQQTECLPLPDALYARIQAAEAALHAIV